MKKIISISSITLFFVPVFAGAAGVMDFVDRSYEIITKYLIPLAFLLCLLYFFWGVAKYIRSINPGQKEEGRSIMIWGIVGLFVASSIWGIVLLIRTELGIPNIQNAGKTGGY